jgi:hypothetical protein
MAGRTAMRRQGKTAIATGGDSIVAQTFNVDGGNWMS